MELNYFKDQIFDLINECDTLDVVDIVSNDAAGVFRVTMADGCVFDVKCSLPVEEL